MEQSFILSDQRIENSHGFYLDHQGGDLERFRANPVMLYDHDSHNVIGRWTNIRLDGDCILADPEFDTEDPDGQRAAGKVQRGYLKGASLGIRILGAEKRYNEQARREELHVNKWEAFEASVTPIPSNSGALYMKICDAQGSPLEGENLKAHLLKLSAGQPTDTKIINPDNQMNTISLSAEALTVLGLKNMPEDMQALSASIMALAQERDTAVKEAATLKADVERQQKERAAALVDAAVKDGRLSADKRDKWAALAVSDYNAAADALADMKPRTTIADKLRHTGGGAPADRTDWNYLKWLKEDPRGLIQLKAEHPDTWQELHDSFSRK